jgi:hypothetical protein
MPLIPKPTRERWRREIEARFATSAYEAIPALLAENARLREMVREACELARHYVEHTLPISRNEADARISSLAREVSDE